MKNSAKSIIVILLSAAIIGCNSEYSNQLKLAKIDKCNLFSKYDQLKNDSTNHTLKEDVASLERMLETRKELSGDVEKFNEELKNHQCK